MSRGGLNDRIVGEMKMASKITSLVVGVVIGLIAGAGAASMLMGATAPTTYIITTAGSTTVYPLSQEWATYVHEDLPLFIVNPATGGSGLGQSQVAAGIIDIGASSSFPSEEYSDSNPNVRVIPISADALAVVANPAVNGSVLKLDSDMCVAIFQRNVTTWEQLESEFGVSIAQTGNIEVYVRSDASGTTATFGKWLRTSGENPNSHANYTWGLGDHESLPWVQGSNAVEGNPGVASGVDSDPQGIGYVGLAFMEGLTTARLYNYGNDEYVTPSLENALKAIPALVTNPGQNLMNSATTGAYPIARFLFYLINENNLKWYVIFYLTWCLLQGQQYIPQVGYVPINGTAAATYALSVIGGLIPAA